MLNRQKINFLIIIVCFILSVNPGVALETSHLLDGKTFIGFNGEKGRQLDPDENEEIVFEDGRFISTTCNKYNFSDVAYSAREIDDGIHFEAVTLSPTHGKIVWQGVVRNNQAEVTFVWTKERWYWNTYKEYWFKGSLKQ